MNGAKEASDIEGKAASEAVTESTYTLTWWPFPSGLRIIGEEVPSLVPWAWGVNGFFTVIGTVGALILGMALGFKAVLVVAALCYLIALGAVTTSQTISPRGATLPN